MIVLKYLFWSRATVSKSKPVKLTKGTFSRVGSGGNNLLYVSIRVSRHDMLSL